MPRRVDKTERRNRIMDAAMRVFARLGVHQARMDDVAREARLSKGALYWYFRSKEDLLKAILARMFEPDLQLMEELVRQRERSAVERLETLARKALDSLPQMRVTQALLYEFYALAARTGPLQVLIRDYYRRYYELLTELLAQGVEQGELRIQNPRRAAMALLAQFEGLFLISVLLPGVDLHQEWQALSQEVLKRVTGENGSF